MKLVPVERPEKAYGNRQRLVLEFLNMGVDCVEVMDLDIGKHRSFAGNFNATAKKMKASCRARIVKGKCYIFANEITDTEKE